MHRTIPKRSLDKVRGRHVVLSLSGGKDSAAVSLLLHDAGIEHDRVFMDTGWEHPRTYQYLDEVLEPRLGPISRIQSERFPGGMVPLLRHKAMFPKRMRRFCTELLKVKPFLRFIESLDEDVINAVGIRAGESQARSCLREWDSMKLRASWYRRRGAVQ